MTPSRLAPAGLGDAPGCGPVLPAPGRGPEAAAPAGLRARPRAGPRRPRRRGPRARHLGRLGHHAHRRPDRPWASCARPRGPRAGRDAGAGRPPVALEVVPDARHVVGIKLSDERHTAVLSDFAGTMLAEASLPTPPARKSLAQVLDDVGALVAELRARAPGRAVAAVGVGRLGPRGPSHGPRRLVAAPRRGGRGPQGGAARRGSGCRSMPTTIPTS